MSRALYRNEPLEGEFPIELYGIEQDLLPIYGGDVWGSGEWMFGYRFPRNIIPAKDKRLAYGRIQALTIDRAKALINRTLQAEARGFKGNVGVGLKGKAMQNIDSTPTEPFLEITDNLYFFQELLHEKRTSACESYLTTSGAFWNPARCRLGANPLGHIAGEMSGHIFFAD